MSSLDGQDYSSLWNPLTLDGENVVASTTDINEAISVNNIFIEQNYLRLDSSNGPITGTLNIQGNTSISGTCYFQNDVVVANNVVANGVDAINIYGDYVEIGNNANSIGLLIYNKLSIYNNIHCASDISVSGVIGTNVSINGNIIATNVSVSNNIRSNTMTASTVNTGILTASSPSYFYNNLECQQALTVLGSSYVYGNDCHFYSGLTVENDHLRVINGDFIIDNSAILNTTLAMYCNTGYSNRIGMTDNVDTVNIEQTGNTLEIYGGTDIGLLANTRIDGSTSISGGITGNSISVTTYYNLPPLSFDGLLNNNLSVNGTSYLRELSVSKIFNTNIQGYLSVSSNATINGTISVSSNATINGTISVNSNARINGTISISSDTIIRGDLILDGDISIGGSILKGPNSYQIDIPANINAREGEVYITGLYQIVLFTLTYEAESGTTGVIDSYLDTYDGTTWADSILINNNCDTANHSFAYTWIGYGGYSYNIQGVRFRWNTGNANGALNRCRLRIIQAGSTLIY